MNQEQNNFNVQNNNGITNNQPLNNQGMGFNQQPINPQPQPQPTPSFQQSINTFESGSTNNPTFDNKPPKKMNLVLIIGIIAVVAIVIGGILVFNNINNNVSNSNQNEQSNDEQTVTIENYDVNLEQVNFTKDNDLYLKQIKGNIIQNIRCFFELNGEYYHNLFLTKDGSLYFLSDFGDSLIKIDKKTNLKHIDGLIKSGDYGANPLIYGNGLFYSLTADGNLETVDSKNIVYPIGISKDDHFIGIAKDKKLTAVLSCKNYDENNETGECNNLDSWFTVKSDMEFNYASATMLVSSENKLYSSKNIYNYMRFDYENMSINISEDALIPILENIVNYYDINQGLDGNSTFFQTSDNKIYIFGQDLILAKYDEPTVFEFNEKIEKIYGSSDNEVLLLANEKIYLFTILCDENNITKCNWKPIDLSNKLIEYKDKIRNFSSYYESGEKYIMLLTNGILYELNTD